MKIRIADIFYDPPRIYIADRPEDCRDATDREAYEFLVAMNEEYGETTVTVGKVIAEVVK